MNELNNFLDIYYEKYKNTGLEIERDQRLPEKKILEEVCNVLLNTSCMREEGRYSSFRVCFIKADSAFLDTYLYARSLLFDKPVRFDTNALHKLAPALNSNLSYLILDVSKNPITAVGIIYAYTTWEKIMTGEEASGNRLPQIPNILISGPGEMEGCIGEASLVRYESGNSFSFCTGVFNSSIVADKLRMDSHVSDEERLKLLYRVIWRALQYGHGGHILIVPSELTNKDDISIKYGLSAEFPTLHDGDEEWMKLDRNKQIIAFADFIAQLTTVDGAVVLTKNLDLVGFGAETHMEIFCKEKPKICFVRENGTTDRSKAYDDNGMRHRSSYSYCNENEEAIAIIMSQDGTVKACTKHEEEIVIYNHIGLPLL